MKLVDSVVVAVVVPYSPCTCLVECESSRLGKPFKSRVEMEVAGTDLILSLRRLVVCSGSWIVVSVFSRFVSVVV